jgi:hypothetical protein
MRRKAQTRESIATLEREEKWIPGWHLRCALE